MQAMTMDPSSDRSDPMTSSSSSLMNMELFCEEKTAQETVKSPATNSGHSLAIARFALNICSIDPYNFTKWTCKFSPHGILFMSVAVPTSKRQCSESLPPSTRVKDRCSMISDPVHWLWNYSSQQAVTDAGTRHLRACILIIYLCQLAMPLSLCPHIAVSGSSQVSVEIKFSFLVHGCGSWRDFITLASSIAKGIKQRPGVCPSVCLPVVSFFF